MLVEFDQSARKHRIGRARVRQVLTDPVAMAVRTSGGLLVIPAMDLQPKWRTLYEEARQ